MSVVDSGGGVVGCFTGCFDLRKPTGRSRDFESGILVCERWSLVCTDRYTFHLKSRERACACASVFALYTICILIPDCFLFSFGGVCSLVFNIGDNRSGGTAFYNLSSFGVIAGAIPFRCSYYLFLYILFLYTHFFSSFLVI